MLQPKFRHRFCALTIAGSDSGGNAGIQADIRAFHAFGVHACTVITALTAQNPFGVRNVAVSDPAIVSDQIDAVLEEYAVGAIKTGMLATVPVINAVAGSILRHGRGGKIVVDPVMIASSGAKLLDHDAVKAMRDSILPLAALVTPNIHEAGNILGRHVETRSDMETAAGEISKRYGCATLIKGGHSITSTLAEDVLFTNGKIRWYSLPVIENPLSTHGTGCSLSAAIAAAIACGADLFEAVKLGKQFVHDAISNAVFVGERATTLHVNFQQLKR
ncbi:MAG: bifunctional hydroxymethylpyrimidine kinase/phosphomethylpyrimidine kinase [Kiritimatiellaeota bacterium]|nr:bifunctional hydroxymethylpyrimidine kinase/phosphomethylpyrimidine kinase [Kiritimatiellota bacterium]